MIMTALRIPVPLPIAPERSAATPRIMRKRFLGKRVANSCETMKTFEVRDDCSIGVEKLDRVGTLFGSPAGR